MGRSGENFISLLDNDKVSIFCAFDKDYSSYRGKIYNENIFKAFLPDCKKAVFMNQIHSNKVIFYPNVLNDLTCDGLISTCKKVALCVLSADCLPLLLWHESGIIAALHSGRKGCFENILKVCLEEFLRLDPELDKSKLHLFVSAGICGENYEISGQILKDAKDKFPNFIHNNKLDLKALVKFQAQDLGILNIEDVGLCSFENEKFYSYRRDKTNGRFVSAIVLKV